VIERRNALDASAGEEESFLGLAITKRGSKLWRIEFTLSISPARSGGGLRVPPAPTGW
jgi:hypothetical protein